MTATITRIYHQLTIHNSHDFWMVCVCCDWVLCLLWFWFWFLERLIENCSNFMACVEIDCSFTCRCCRCCLVCYLDGVYL